MRSLTLMLQNDEVIKTTKGQSTSWTYIAESHVDDSGKRYVLVKCTCGIQKIVRLNNIRSGGSTCCNQCSHRTRKKKKKDPEVGFRAIQYVYMKHAKERNLSYELSYENFKILVQSNCNYCGVEPQQLYQLRNSTTQKIRSGVPILYNGIDRIDSTKGYSLENVVSCCKICNRAKGNLTVEDFNEWILRIINQNKN